MTRPAYRFDVITLFGPLCEPYVQGSILGRAQRQGLIDVRFTDVRDFTSDPHRTVDDAPFGGGAGMVMLPEPLALAVEHVRTTRAPARVVLLSPGPTSSGYFEDVYLARYLGYTLVEGGDLTVRDNGVFLKTLGGLLPVDVVLRRLQDSDCDPLELRSERMLGVPGLLQAVRSGNVVVANALGSGMLEAPALAAP